jgi:hypothetical protein
LYVVLSIHVGVEHSFHPCACVRANVFVHVCMNASHDRLGTCSKGICGVI